LLPLSLYVILLYNKNLQKSKNHDHPLNGWFVLGL